MGLGLGSRCSSLGNSNWQSAPLANWSSGDAAAKRRQGQPCLSLRRLGYRRSTRRLCKLQKESPEEDELSLDVDSFDQHYSSQPWLVASRFAEVMTAFVRLGIAHGLPFVEYSNVDKQALGRELCKVLTVLGPTFIKVGQTLATRPDVIGEDIARELENLQTGAPPFSNQIAMQVIEEELGQPIEILFTFLSKEPIASASLGQVYFGVLAACGTEVAVKVQRPNMVSSITLDIYVLRSALGLVRSLASINQDIRLVADEVGRGLLGELDYQGEAQRSEEFKSAHLHLGFVEVPDVIYRLTTKRVLTTIWVDGLSPTDYLSYMEGDFPRQNMYYKSSVLAAVELLTLAEARAQVLSMMEMGVECSLSQLLQTGVMHADPHPGNIMRTLSGSIVYLDFGLLTQVPPASSQAMMSALVHIVLGNFPAFVEDMDKMGLLKPTIDRLALAKDLESELAGMMRQDGSERLESMGDGVQNQQSPLMILLSSQQTQLSFGVLSKLILKLAIKYRFRLPPYYTLIVRSLATLEGVALKTDPSFKIVKAAFPTVLRQLLCDSRPAATILLRELLLDESNSLKLDWLGDLVDLYEVKTMDQIQPPPRKEIPSYKPVSGESSRTPGRSDGQNGSGPLYATGDESISQVVPGQRTDYDQENQEGSNPNGSSQNGGSAAPRPDGEEVKQNGDYGVANASTSNGSSPDESHSAGSTSPRPQDSAKNPRGRIKLKGINFWDMLLSRQSHGLRRVLIECDILKLVNNLKGSEGERWRLLLASALTAVILQGLKSVLRLSLNIILIPWTFFRRGRGVRHVDKGNLPRVHRKRLRFLLRVQFQKLRRAGVRGSMALIALFVKVLWVAMTTWTGLRKRQKTKVES